MAFHEKTGLGQADFGFLAQAYLPYFPSMLPLLPVCTIALSPANPRRISVTPATIQMRVFVGNEIIRASNPALGASVPCPRSPPLEPVLGETEPKWRWSQRPPSRSAREHPNKVESVKDKSRSSRNQRRTAHCSCA